MLEATYAYGADVKAEQRRVELFEQNLAKTRSGTVDGEGAGSVDSDWVGYGYGDEIGDGDGDGDGDGVVGPVRWRCPDDSPGRFGEDTISGR